MCGTGDNFDWIVTKICIYLGNGQRMGEFQCDSCRIYDVCGISNTSFEKST